MTDSFGTGTRALDAAPSPRMLPVGTPIDLDDVRIAAPGRPLSTGTKVLERWGTRALVVLHRGEIVVEWAVPGHDPARPQKCYSVTKSMVGTVLAELMAEGRVQRDQLVGAIVPALSTSGFADATVGDIADMTVEIAYDEDYAEIAGGSSSGRGHHFGDYVVALGMEEDGGTVDDDAARSIRDFLPRIGRGSGRHGSAFHYATPITDVVGWIIESVTARDPVDLVIARIWERAGPEWSARWGTDRVGTPSVGAGLEVTTRDLARIGLLLAERSQDGGDDVGARALADIRRGGSPVVFAADGHYSYLQGYSYRGQWWIPMGPDGPISGWGIFGQFLWIDPDADVVIACHGRDRTPSDPDRDLDQHALCVALTEAALASAVPSSP